jgi:ribosomal protein S18 acetylase RimI-like enzyme
VDGGKNLLIKELNRVNSDVAKEINELVEQCNNYDGIEGIIELDKSINFSQEMNTIFMAYEDNKLVSVLSLFVPGCEEAEVSAMTLPDYRLRGYFSELIKRAEAEIKRYDVPDILYVCNGNSAKGKAVIAKQNAQYEFTEYFLKYNHKFDPVIKDCSYRIKLHKAGLEDIESIAKISMAAFNNSYERAISYAKGAINADNRELFLGEADGEFVAMGVICFENGGASINGLGVLPEHQGRGYGKEMLYSIILRIMEHKVEDICIEVESENDNAFQLYKNSGFEVQNAWEYYRKTIE